TKTLVSIFSRNSITVLKFKSQRSRGWPMQCRAWRRDDVGGLEQESNLRPAVAGLRSGKHSLHADFISCHPADDHTFCNPKLNKHMKKSVLSLITVLIGIAFIASCAPQQGGTTATSTTAAATKSPSPSPTHKKRATTKKKKA